MCPYAPEQRSAGRHSPLGRKIHIVTLSRSDFGPLIPVIDACLSSPEIDLTLSGSNWNAQSFRQEGFVPDHELLLPDVSDAPDAALVAASVARQIPEILIKDRPDWLLVLGDRYELLSVATCATILRIPIAHLCGGDVTEGAIDENIRHAVTKLASLHFVTHKKAKARVEQMGEAPDRVIVAGHTSLDRAAAFRAGRGDRPTLPWQGDGARLLVCLHPVTKQADLGASDLEAMCSALLGLDESVRILTTAANPDPFGADISSRFQALAAGRPNWWYTETLGQQGFFTALDEATVIVGNSSAGLYEAPYFGTRTINIGDRQHGRTKPPVVVDVPSDARAITQEIRNAIASPRVEPSAFWGDGRACGIILDTLLSRDPKPVIRKEFHDIE